MASDIAIKIDNRYEVLGELGRGGMGIVYKANDLKIDRLVAIKVMTPRAPGQDEYQERFLREAKSIAKLQHPNIVVVYDYGYHGGSPYIAMEYVEGVPLDKVIASRVSLTPLAKVDYVVQVCHALHYAHQQGIVHRDVKPGNIMILDGGKRVKLLDFGIARAGNTSNLSKSGLAMGTTCYMSPEQTKGQKDLDGRADIFSAGVVLYELLAGKPPWTGDSDYEVMTKVIHEPCPPLSSSGNYPAILDQILERALAKDRNARYQTADELALALAVLEVPLKEQALEQALVQFEHGDLSRANDLVSQILRVDTRHREAIELRTKLQQVAQLQQKSTQVQQLRITAEEAVGQKRYTDALSALEQAITIDSADTELFHYRELIRNEVKRREDIRKKLELARRAQEINDLSTAQELVDKALEADPTDTHARMMKSNLEQERKRQQLQEIADEASGVLAVRAFARAAEIIQKIEALDPNFAPLASLKRKLIEGEAEEKRRLEIEHLIQEIRRVLGSGDVAQSLSITQQALVRFPGEPRLIRLRNDAEAMRDAGERAIHEQVALVKRLMEAGQNTKALAAAENALERLGADHRLQTLVAQVRQAVERERQLHAEQSVLAQARDAMRGGDVDSALKILTAARNNLPNSREIADALQAAQRASAKKSDDLRAEKIVEALERALANESDPELQIRLAEETVRKIAENDAAQRALARVRDRRRQIVSAADRAQQLEQAQRYPEAIQEWERIRQLWPQHPQMATAIARLKDASRAPAKAPEAQAAPAPGLSATRIMMAMSSAAPAPVVERPPEAMPAAPPPAPALRKQPQRTEPWKSIQHIPWRLGLVSLLALVTVVFGIIYIVHKAQSATRRKTFSSIAIKLHANIDGAKFKLDGRSIDPGSVSLIAGREYAIEASREGYQSEVKKITAPATAAGPIEFTLTALAPRLSLSSDLKNVQVSLGEKQRSSLQSGEFGPEELPFGSTTLKVWDGRRLLLVLPLDIQPGKPVTLAGSMQAQDCSVAVLSQLGNSARVYATSDLKGNSSTLPAQPIPPEGLAAEILAPSTEFKLSDGRSWTLQPANTPTLTISVSTTGEVGTLQVQVEANVSEAQLKIDKDHKTAMADGSKAVLLKAGKHQIQVFAPGYADSEVREVEILKGKTVKEAFTLSALQAQLSLTEVEPGATAYLDGESRGTTSESGSLKLDVSPGQHRIALKKPNYEDSPTVTREFKAKQPQIINGKQLPLVKHGSLSFAVTPPNATITIHVANGPSRIVRADETVFLPKGAYQWTIEADHFKPMSGTAAVEPGMSSSIARSLQLAGPQELDAAALFEDPSLWSHRGDWWVFKQSGYGWLKLRNGSFNVIIEKRGIWGKKKVEWTLDYRGETDKIVYSAGGNTLSRQVVSSGNPVSKPVKSQFKERSEIYQFIFDISPSRIVVRDNGNNPIDEFDRPDSGVDLGRIGFRGEISISVQRLR